MGSSASGWRAQLIYLEGQCVPHGATTPYLPVLDLLRTACGLSESDDAEAMAQRLGEAVQAVGMDPARAVPMLLHLLGARVADGPWPA